MSPCKPIGRDADSLDYLEVYSVGKRGDTMFLVSSRTEYPHYQHAFLRKEGRVVPFGVTSGLRACMTPPLPLGSQANSAGAELSLADAPLSRPTRRRFSPSWFPD